MALARIARALLTAGFVLILVGGGATSARAGGTVKPPPGAARPVAATGIGTPAAMTDPRCNTGEDYGGYGRWSSASVGGGPVCVRPWNGGGNGGATSPGVTKDKVTIVAIIPSAQQTQDIVSGALGRQNVPTNRATGQIGAWEDAVHDHLLPVLEYHETWGRDLEVKFVVSSGADEAAQRADAVVAQAAKPFAAIDLYPDGLLTLEAELAKRKIIVYGNATTAKQALEQQPYRWGPSDAQAFALNAANILGSQMAGKKATFAGDALEDRTRVFGAVAADIVDLRQFERDLKKHGGELAAKAEYNNPFGIAGDATKAQELAGVTVPKLKEAGVTTVILFADNAMVRTLMDVATSQDYFPEWFNTGTLYSDLGFFSRGYPPEQSRHMFGMSYISPYLVPDPPPAPPAKSITTLANVQNWYWGEGQGTSSNTIVAGPVTWLLTGIHGAGPNLTPKTFRQGFFAIPAQGGAATDNPLGAMIAYGRQAALPYASYLAGGADFVPFWYDPDTTGHSSATGGEGMGVQWYPDGGKRYKADTIPGKLFAYFDRSGGAIYQFDTRPAGAPPIEYAGDCSACPVSTGATAPGSPSQDGFVARAGGGGSAAP
jgi:hypothetical protein